MTTDCPLELLSRPRCYGAGSSSSGSISVSDGDVGAALVDELTLVTRAKQIKKILGYSIIWAGRIFLVW